MNDAVQASAPPDRNLLGRWTPWIAVLVLGAVCGAVFTASSESGRDRESADLDGAFVYDVERYKTIPPEQLGYREVGQIETGLERATALAVGPEDDIVVGGDERVLVLDPAGKRRHVHEVPSTPLAVAVSPEGVLFVGLRRLVLEGPLAGPLTRLLQVPGGDARITSITAGSLSLFVADAGARLVWHHDRTGSVLGRIGERDRDRGVLGFVVPSPYFDVHLAPDGLLRIVDPGRHLVTAFTIEGDLELSWGRPSFQLEGFSGCCNPAHIALLPNGHVVTSEKGIARVKVYDAHGRFVTAVVGPDGLDTEHGPCEVAADGAGRILVLDPGRGRVRLFEPVTQEGPQ